MGKYSKKEALSIIVKCAKNYKEHLAGKALLIVAEKIDAENPKPISCTELTFDASNFMHLTGVVTNLKAKDFFHKCLDGKLKFEDFDFSADNTTQLKLEVLTSIINKNLSARMIGDYCSKRLKLQTQKLAGGDKCCIGFITSSPSERYVPNTILKEDIRQCSENLARVIAVFRKVRSDEYYTELTYKAKNIDLGSIKLPVEYSYLPHVNLETS